MKQKKSGSPRRRRPPPESGARRAGDALRLPRERDLLTPRRPWRAPKPRKRRRPPPRSSSSRRPTKRSRKAEAKQQADRGSLDAALCRVAALKRDLEIAESKAQDIPEPPPAPSGSVLDALEGKAPRSEKLAEDAQNALSQATAARADLAKERAVSTKLRAEIDQSKRDAKGAALEREKVRALEAQIKVLSEQDAEDSKIRAERDALLAERREWAIRFRGLVDGSDDKNVARQALDLLKVTIDA